MIFIIKGFRTIVFIFIVILQRFGRYVLRKPLMIEYSDSSIYWS